MVRIVQCSSLAISVFRIVHMIRGWPKQFKTLRPFSPHQMHSWQLHIYVRGVLVGLFLPVSVHLYHKYWPYSLIFRRWSTKGRILGRWRCWCVSLTCSDTCISQALIEVHKDAGCVAASRSRLTGAVCGISESVSLMVVWRYIGFLWY